MSESRVPHASWTGVLTTAVVLALGFGVTSRGRAEGGGPEPRASAAPTGVASSPTVLATGQISPRGLAVHGDEAFWVNDRTRVVSSSLQGGGIHPGPLGAAEPPAAYWRLLPDGSGLTALRTASVLPATPTFAVDLVRHQGTADEELDVAEHPDEGRMWDCLGGLTSDGEAFYVSTGRALVRVSKSGASPKELVRKHQCASPVAVDAARVYWAESSSYDDAEIWAIPKKGGTPTRVARREPAVLALAVDARALYWVNVKGGLRTMQSKGGAVRELHVSSGLAAALVASGTDLYFARGTDLLRLPKNGGTPETLARSSSPIRELAVGEKAVAFLTKDEVFAVPR
jgi:hypothetical protein